MAKFIRLSVKEGSQLFNIERIIRIRKMDLHRTRIYTEPFMDSAGSLLYFVDVDESQETIEKKLGTAAGIY